jgi:hypothetical protein
MMNYGLGNEQPQKRFEKGYRQAKSGKLSSGLLIAGGKQGMIFA